jgi:CheY-like chemotaxis protein/MinD-like ATPase involved in chromosome partitioning or flagellar assembly
MPEKILIVDDDLETLRLVGLMLQRQGYQVVAANNGSQALTVAHNELPDLIVLDVMMPDMDGYQVTRNLRSQPETANVPILMFSAKSQVDDKVVGYDAGVDDYLTKPVHPVELVARIKALLTRGKGRQTAGSAERGYTVGVMAPKGGLGVSSLVLNLALAYYQKTKLDLIAAELLPGHGTWGLELGFANPSGLCNLLRMKPNEITPSLVERELIRTTYGIRLLMASIRKKDVELATATSQLDLVIQQLQQLTPLLLLDLGTMSVPMFDRSLALCQELLVVTEPYPTTVQHTRSLLEELMERGFGKLRPVTLVIVNRVRADVQMSITQVQEKLGMPISHVIPPAPEQAFQAGMRNIPLIMVQPDGLVAQQFYRLADFLAGKQKK